MISWNLLKASEHPEIIIRIPNDQLGKCLFTVR